MTDVVVELGGRFRSRGLAEAFVSAYRAELARWPLPVDPLDVAGDYGTTRVQVCGRPTGAPLVLLHGGGCTSTSWFANVGALGDAHRVYAPDQIGDAGMSVARGRPIREVGDYMAWLDGLLDALGLSRASVCGYSYGAWLALNYALHRPTRVRRLALLEPTTCFAGLGLAYLARTCPALARRSARRVRRVIEWETGRAPLDPSSTALACLGCGEYRGRVSVTPHPPAPARIRAMEVPTLVVLAGRARVHDVGRVHTAARGLLADATIRVLPGARHHFIPITDAPRLNPELAGFLR
ncbi:MAG TPA: alpha/beta fold hydrolase [Acidimicrobiales bacterium]|nr:alpha/beta fold hydrolase [Acidimicrobiales bacterium]